MAAEATAVCEREQLLSTVLVKACSNMQLLYSLVCCVCLCLEDKKVCGCAVGSLEVVQPPGCLFCGSSDVVQYVRLLSVSLQDWIRGSLGLCLRQVSVLMVCCVVLCI